MILFCEECGTRHDIDSKKIVGSHYQFACTECSETLLVSLSKNQGKQVHAAMQSEAAAQAEPVKVLVVDDSKLIRKVLRQIIESNGRFKVAGEAENGQKALDILSDTRPDVITLDINMPVMDGLTALKHIMIKRPTPTVMISALTKEGAVETFEALKYGAIDFLPKPSQVKGADLNAQRDHILHKLDLAAGVQIESVRYLRRSSQTKHNENQNSGPCEFVLTIGAADGGYGTLLNVIPGLRRDLSAAYVAVLHQAPHHVDAFVRYLDHCSQLAVKRATEGAQLQPGSCYLAAMHELVTFDKSGEGLHLKVKTSSESNGPGAVDTMMQSASFVLGNRSAGIILSGTGNDGIEGLASILEAGGATFVQNPVNCLFKETPSFAIEAFTIDSVVSDKQMAGAINAYLMSHSV